MKTSVLMTLYNGEAYLIEQLDSIRNQTRVPDEVIICDDGSKDNSVSMVQEYIHKYGLEDSWRLYINEKNLGYANNFCNGMKYTQGDIVFFCDQDDVWYECKLEEMSRIMEDNAKIKLLCTEFDPFICSEDAPSIPAQFMRYMTGSGLVEQLALNEKTIFIGSEGCVMSIRKDFFEDILEYHFDGWAHDEFVWKMAVVSGSCYYYHKPMIKRRMHSANVSKQKMHDIKKRIGFLERLLVSHNKMLEYGCSIGINNADKSLIKKNIEAAELRIGLLKDKRYVNFVKLAFCYRKNYQSRKSIPVELFMAMKG